MEATLGLRALVGVHGCTEGLADGLLEDVGVSLRFEEEPGLIQGFRRMVRDLDVDVCEMALTTYLCAKAHGKAFTALPVFPHRAFHHGAVVALSPVRTRGPRALEGARVGVNRGYTVTTGVWARGILQDEHGVDLSRVVWVRSADEHVREYRPPANVEDLAAGGDLGAQLAEGRLAAVVGGRVEVAGAAPLVADAEEAAYEALVARGHYPINHCVVVRDELLAADPGIGRRLFEAFAEAKRAYLGRLAAGRPDGGRPEDRTYGEVLARTGRDPLPYGLEANRRVLEELVRHALTQGILDRPPPLESLFAPGTLALGD